jgi:hypothetical protein
VWILKKRAHVTGFYATSTFLNSTELRRMYLQEHGGAIRWIKFLSDFATSVNFSAYAPAVRDIVQYCPNLTRLDGETCLDETTLSALARSCPLLEELSICGRGYTCGAVVALSKHCTRLRELSLTCANVSDEECLIALIRANPGLQTFSTCAAGATERFLRELALNCAGLADFSINCVNVTLPSIYFLMKHCPLLSRMYIEDARFLPSAEEQPLVQCASMRSLTLSGLDILDEELDALLQCCPGLTELEVWSCDALDELDTLAVAEHCPALQKLAMFGNASAAGDEVLRCVGNRCPQLRELQIQEGEAVSDRGVIAVLRKCPLLEHLDVYGCKRITDKCLAILPACCPKLRVLIVCECPKITEAGVDAVMQGCADLAALGVDGCTKIKAKTRRAIEERYPSTQYV